MPRYTIVKLKGFFVVMEGDIILFKCNSLKEAQDKLDHLEYCYFMETQMNPY